MGLREFKESLAEEHIALADLDFQHIITDTTTVPDINDPAITYPEMKNRIQKSKRLQSAILFVDMRGSTAMSLNNQEMTNLAPVYAAFIRSMSRCAHYYGGKVRNIIGDRVMVVFDKEDCFAKAINTAILMNSVVQYMLKNRFKGVEIKAGIGIDYGQMLVSKSGVIKQGDENDPNKSLVWLGKPANVASKLTDVANKSTTKGNDRVLEHHYYRNLDEHGFYDIELETFFRNLTMEIVKDNVRLTHKDASCYAATFMPADRTTNPPILMTKYFYDLYVKENPEAENVKNGWWSKQYLTLPDYPNEIYGGHVIFTIFKGTQ